MDISATITWSKNKEKSMLNKKNEPKCIKESFMNRMSMPICEKFYTSNLKKKNCGPPTNQDLCGAGLNGSSAGLA